MLESVIVGAAIGVVGVLLFPKGFLDVKWWLLSICLHLLVWIPYYNPVGSL